MDAALLAHQECSLEDPRSEQCVGTDDSATHQRAARNVNHFLYLFLLFDALVLVSYGHATLANIAGPNRWGMAECLVGMVTFCFMCDISFGVSLVWALSHDKQRTSVGPQWEDHYRLILVNLVSNLISLLTLACLRLYQTQGDKYLMVAALVYLCLRATKLRRLFQLEQAVAHVRSHAGAPASSRYGPLLTSWAVETDTRVEKCMLRVLFLSIATIVITLAIAGLCDATGVTRLVSRHDVAVADAAVVLVREANASMVASPEKLDAWGDTAYTLEDTAHGGESGALFGAGIGVAVATDAVTGATVGGAVGGAVGAGIGLVVGLVHR